WGWAAPPTAAHACRRACTSWHCGAAARARRASSSCCARSLAWPGAGLVLRRREGHAPALEHELLARVVEGHLEARQHVGAEHAALARRQREPDRVAGRVLVDVAHRRARDLRRTD